jgi:hypothetical protein
MWQQLAAGVMVAMAAFYLIRMAIRRHHRTREQMDAGCSGCSLATRSSDASPKQPE